MGRRVSSFLSEMDYLFIYKFIYLWLFVLKLFFFFTAGFFLCRSLFSFDDSGG